MSRFDYHALIGAVRGLGLLRLAQRHQYQADQPDALFSQLFAISEL
jgi:hypothetical protein